VAAGFETIGWTLSIKDLATDVVKKVAGMVKATAAGVSKSTSGMRVAMSQVSDRMPEFQKTSAETGKAIQEAFGAGHIVKGFQEWGKGLKDIAPHFTGASMALTGIEASLVGVVKSVADLVQLKSPLTGLALTFTGAVTTLAGVPGLLKTIMFMGRRAGSAVGELLQKFISIETITKGIDAMGGLAGILLGPLAPLLKLFQPLISMVVDQFTPAIETFSEIVSNAFGPFSMTLEIIARNLATKLVPLIEPFASFLELAAVQVGIFVQSLLEGKPDKVFIGLFDAFMKLQPVAMDLLDILMKVGMDVMGTLIDATIKLAPLFVETFAKLLKAIIPVIEPLTKLTITLLEKVFVPLLIKSVEILDTKLIPLIDAWMPTLIQWIDFLTERLDDFFGNFEKYWSDFNIVIVEPFAAWLNGIIEKITPMAMQVKTVLIDPIVAYIQPIIDKVMEVAESVSSLLGMNTEVPETAAAGAGLEKALDVREAATGAQMAGLEGLTGEARRQAFDEFLRKKKGLADGGVVQGPTTRLVGEAGPELVLPLKREVVAEVLTPLIPDMAFPALDKLLAVAASIDRRISGTLRVDTGVRSQPQRQPQPNPFSGAVGMEGVGSW
jgi:hypothetical protein